MRELSSPFQTSAIHQLAHGEIGVQLRKPLNDTDTLRFNEFLSRHPEAWVRIYSGPGQQDQDWSWLGSVSSLRRVWIDLLPEHRFEPVWLGLLSPALESLYLPGALDLGKGIEVLSRFAKLRELSISGRLRDLGVLVHTPRLESLKIFRGKDVSFRSMMDARSINRISIESSRGVSLEGLAALPSLQALSVFDSSLLNSDAIANLIRLERISIVSVKFDSELPTLSELKNLRQLRISSLKPLWRLELAMSAPGLEVLSLDRFKKDFIEVDFASLRLPARLRRIYLGELRGAERDAMERGLGLKIDSHNSDYPFGVGAVGNDW